MSAGSRWARVAERGSDAGLRITVACYRLFGRPASVVLVHLVLVYFFLTGRAARAASRAYLRRVASVSEGAAALGRPPGFVASFLHFRAFALSVFDRMVLWFGREGGFRFEVEGRAVLDRALADGRGALVVGAHLGSFDALRALAERDGRSVNVLMHTRHAPRINAVFRRLSPDVQMRVLAADAGAAETVLRIRACLERGELVAMLGDRVEPGDRGRTARVALLGAPVELPTAPYDLAAVLGRPLLFMVALREGSARYRVYAEALAEGGAPPRAEREKRVRELAAAFAARLERFVLVAPYQWFNFYDYWGDAEA